MARPDTSNGGGSYPENQTDGSTGLAGRITSLESPLNSTRWKDRLWDQLHLAGGNGTDRLGPCTHDGQIGWKSSHLRS